MLKSTGSPIIMVYAKHSLNYQVSIRIIRRLGLALLMPVPRKLPGIYERHRKNARKVGPASQFRSPLDGWTGQSVFKGLYSPGIGAGLPELSNRGGIQALDACATATVAVAPRRALARLAPVGSPRTAAGVIAAPRFTRRSARGGVGGIIASLRPRTGALEQRAGQPSRARRAGESDPGGAAFRDGVAARHQPMRLG